MKCVICHSPKNQKKQVEEEIKSNHDILLMTIDVLQCSNEREILETGTRLI